MMFKQTICMTAVMAAAICSTIAQAESWGIRENRDGRCKTLGDALSTAAEAKVRMDWSNGCSIESEKTWQAFYNERCSDPSINELTCNQVQKNIARESVLRDDMKEAFESGVVYDDKGTKTPGYPVYGQETRKQGKFVASNEIGTTGKHWMAPPMKLAADTGLKNSSCSDIPKGFEVIGFCASGCYAPNQLLLTSSGQIEAATAYENKTPELVTLSADSMLGSLRFRSSKVGKYTTDFVEGEQELLVFNTISGGSLKVTLNHPLVTEQGSIKMAVDFAVGDALVKMDGRSDMIASIQKVTEVTKVYNFDVVNENPVEKILVAQGYLNGSVYFQNQGVQMLNRKMLRRNADKIIE